MEQQTPVSLNPSMNSKAPLPEAQTARQFYDRWPSRRDLMIQRIWGWIVVLPFCYFMVVLLRFVGNYRIKNIQSIRKMYRDLARDPSPLLICSNHLTFIDSILIIWALAPNYRKFTWNLPAGDFFKKKWLYRLVAYLGKCIFIHRDGSKRHLNAILNLCQDLLSQKEVVTIFPEGKRSRTGRFDLQHLTHGVGRIVSHVPGCRVLCLYIRGDRQETFSNYPPRGSTFHVDYQLTRPQTSQKGREAYHDVTFQIAQVIKSMEDRYFKSNEVGHL
jgi:1-acyl-sn-glycerol-3-phosphate acyltransferase